MKSDREINNVIYIGEIIMNVNGKRELSQSNLVKRMNRIAGDLESVFYYMKVGERLWQVE